MTSPIHAYALHLHFTSKRLTQSNALGDSCEVLEPDATSMPIGIEIVQGRKEEMYWQKVPEKVRRAALEKVTSGLDGNGDGGRGATKEEMSGKKRKRRR